MACIYRVINDKTGEFYVGQDGGDDLERLKSHIRSAFTNRPDACGVLFRQCLWKDLRIEIFSGADYGFDSSVYREFFNRIIPHGKRSQREKENNPSYNALSDPITNPSDNQKRDAAEILHTFILMKENNYKSLSRESGGQYKGGWCLIGSEDKIFSIRQPELLKDAIKAISYTSIIKKLQERVHEKAKETLFSGELWEKYLLKLVNYIVKNSFKAPWDLSKLVAKHFIDNYLTTKKIQTLQNQIYYYDQGKSSYQKYIIHRDPEEVKKFISLKFTSTTPIDIKEIYSHTFKNFQEAYIGLLEKIVSSLGGIELQFTVPSLFTIKNPTDSSIWKSTIKPDNNDKVCGVLKRAAANGMRTMLKNIDKASEEDYSWYTVSLQGFQFGITTVDDKTLSEKLKGQYKSTGFSDAFMSSWQEYYGNLINYALPVKKLVYSGEETKSGKSIWVARKQKYELSMWSSPNVLIKTYKGYIFSDELETKILIADKRGSQTIPDSLLSEIKYY